MGCRTLSLVDLVLEEQGSPWEGHFLYQCLVYVSFQAIYTYMSGSTPPLPIKSNQFVLSNDWKAFGREERSEKLVKAHFHLQ